MNKSIIKIEIIYLMLILLLLIPNILSASKQLPVETHILWERDYLYVASCSDINKDSLDELIAIIKNNTIQPSDQVLTSVTATSALADSIFNNHSISGGIDKDDMWATFIRKDSLFIYNVWQGKQFFITFGKDNHTPVGWNGDAKQVELSDINSDGRLEAVINVVTGWDLKPRGIYVIDFNTGRLLWKFLSGPVIYSFSLLDIDGDKKKEILCGTQAVGNGNNDNGTVDWLSYVFLLNSDGKLRWLQQIGYYSSIADAKWLLNKKTEEYKVVVIEEGSSVGERPCDSIFVFNANGDITAKAQYGKFNNSYTVINDEKSEPLIVTGGIDDTLRICNENLKIVRKCFISGDGCQNIIAGHFTGGKESEIVVSTTNGQLLLFNTQLKLLSQFPVGQIFDISLVKFLNKTRLLIHINHENQLVWRLVGYNIIPFLNRRVPLVSVIISAIILLSLFIIGMVYARYTKTRDIRMVIRGLTGKSGVIELNRKGDIVTISPRAREILKIEEKDSNQALKLLSENKQIHPIIELAKSLLIDSAIPSPQETAISMSQEQSYLVQCIRVKNGVLITFEDISAVEYMKRITSWAPVAQKLAHGIKTPLMNIQLSAQQLESSCEPIKDKTEKIIDGIKSEATRLRKLTDNFMRFTQFSQLNLSLENINDILKDLCNKYSFTIPERIKIDCELSNESLNVTVDRKEIETAISIIIDNAVEAMNLSKEQKQNVLGVKTFIAEKQEKEKIKKYAVIEISDTGKGIPEKYLSELFKPYFTYGKPEGTGLGLTLAKKIIESHNGNIEIQSKEDIGTTVSIFLPFKI